MSAQAVIVALLNAATGVTAIVQKRIYPEVLPQDCPVPAITYIEVVAVEKKTMGPDAANHQLVESRIQVNAIARDYPTKVALIRQVRIACREARGVIAGVSVLMVAARDRGPDLRDDDLGLTMQSIDFIVHWQDT